MDANSMEKYLIQIEDVLESSKAVPFSGKVAVDKDQIYDIIDEIRLNLPSELKESKKLVENKDKFLRDAEKRSESAIESARQEAESILQDAYNKAEKMISEHQIYKTAEEEAELIMQEAKRDAKSIRVNAVDYADEILSKAETAMRATIDSIEKNHSSAQEYYNRILDTLYENRQELRS
ncbi:MAG: ATPase [Defluviitaleaceae bacterium]|nr:ATPase [Defluviitaleaceae bacterium]